MLSSPASVGFVKLCEANVEIKGLAETTFILLILLLIIIILVIIIICILIGDCNDHHLNIISLKLALAVFSDRVKK